MLQSEEILWAPALKKTKQRQLVLEVLRQAQAPLTALDIAGRLERQGTPVWLSTVYRVLDSFVEHAMLQKTTVVESGMAVFEINDRIHRHYAVCIRCHKIIPLENCPLESFQPELGEADFQVLGHRLQMYGFCSGCLDGYCAEK